MGNKKKIITKLIIFVIFIACTIVLMNRSVITGSLKAISNRRNDGTNVYRVSYVSNGGKWTSGSPYEYGYLEYVYGDYIGEPTDADITHNGCTLEGWYTDSNYTNKWDFSTGTIDQNMTLYANWERNIYTVEFREIYDDYTGEDVVLDSVEVPYGYTLVLDGDASDETLTFKYNGPELSTVNFKNWISSTGTYTITQDTVFFARYENENVYVLNVNYLFQNGAVASHNKVTTLIEGGTYNLDTPIIRGYTPSTPNINGVLNQTSVAAFQADDETGNADNIEVKKVDDTTYYVTYFILFTPNQTTYKVNHYLQKVDLSGYDLQESIEYDETIIDGNSKTVYVGDKINPILNTYEGFTHNTERSDLTGKALPDGESELNQYYDRNTYYIYAANTGDTYFDPIPIVYGANINFNETATRRGYTFNGWTWSYTLGGEAISSLSTMPARDLYVSANWTATTTTYIFSYYEEYANSDAYVNIGNIEQNGNTGTNLSTLNLTNSIQNGFRSLESEYTYFTYNQTKTLEENNNFDVVISGDGTTKINIYYRRNRYTITFNLNDRNDRTKAILTMNGNNYTTATTQYSFVAKFNQDISTLWPKATDFTQNPSSGNFYGWKRNGASNTYASMRNNLTLDMLSSTTDGSSTTYQANYINGGSTVHLYYMAESFDQTSPATETRRNYQGVYYDSIPEFEQTVITNTTGFSAKELANLTKVGNESTTSGNGNNRVYTYYFYYSRNTLNLTFWNVIENDTNLSTSLPYGSDLSSYSSSVPNEYPIVTPGEGEWTFDQWYQDPDCTIPMDFDTELETNLTVYAKWIPPQYNITFNVNEGDWNDLSSTYTDNGDGTYSYSVDEATVMTPPTEPTRYGYTFDGWYYDAEIDGVQRNIRYIFDESQKVYNDLSLEAHWSNSLYVQYRVKYIKGQKDINGDLITDINQYTSYETVLDDKVVTNILFDSTVTEQAANVVHAGEEIYYLADSQFKTLKLDAEDEEDNIIYFFYDSSDEAYYTVYYLRYNNKDYDRSETPDPTEYLAQPKTITLKTAADGTLVSERAETIFGYTVRDNWYQELQLIANQDHNKMFFYYDNNSEYGDYSVNIYLMDSGTETYGNTPTYTYAEYGIVGSTIFSNSYLGRDYIPVSIWDTYKLDNMYSDIYIIISDGEDVVTDLNIYLKLKDYTITYQLDGGTWNEESNIYTHNDSSSEYYELVKSGNTCTEPTAATKAGYTFLGWFDEDDNEFDFSTTITSDLTLIAKWAPRTDLTYTVKYIDQFRNTEIQAEKVVPNNTIGSVIHISDEIVEIAGYTYQGGYSGELTIDADESLNVITLYYILNTDVPYTVNHWGQKVGGDPSIHDAENYDLGYTETLYGEAYAEVTPAVGGDQTFSPPPTQTVTIAPDGSTVVNYYYTRISYELKLYKGLGIESVIGAGTYQAGSSVTIDAVVKEGYTWRAWTDCDCGGVEVCQCNPCNCNEVSKNQQYTFEMYSWTYARTAEATPNTYTITYNGNGATGGNTEASTHTYDEAKNLSPNGYEREYTITYDYNYEGVSDTTQTVEYGFNGWNDAQDGSGNSFDNEAEVLNLVSVNNGNKTLYADWTSTSYTNNPTREGYTFAGWYEDEDTNGNRVDADGEYIPTSDITLYAKWIHAEKVLTYTVEYYKDEILVPGDTQVVTDTVQVTDPDIITVIKDNIDTISKYEGYRLDSTDPNPIPDTIASGSTIKVKYVKRTDLTVTINHYWTRMDGTNPVLYESTQLTGLTFGEVIVGEELQKMYEGYVYDHSDTITVGVSPTDNVIGIFYYAKNVPYTVNHWVQKIGKDPSIHDENNYDLEYEEQLYGEADAQVTPDVYDNFYYILPPTQTVIIARDGSTVVNYYYGIKTVRVTVRPGPGIESVSGGGEYLIWSDATIDAVVKEGYTWLYWNFCEHDNCTNEFPCPDSGVSGEKVNTFTVGDEPSTAVAEARPNIYTITYNGNGATGGATETSSHTYDTPKNLTPNGYERKYTITYDYNYDEQADTTQTVAYGFNGWNDAQDGSGNSYNNEAEVLNWLSTDNANKDIYAQWTTSSYTNTPTREGYIFAGWYDNEETTGSRLDINGEYTPTSDITLYAKWEIDNNSTKTLQYTVEYYKDGDKVEADTIVVTDVVQVLEPDTITVNSTLINDNNKYDGYRLDHTDPATVPSVVNTGTTIKVYYVKRSDLTGTINHYLTKADGTNATLKESTPLTGLTFNDVLTGENYKNTYAGYTYYSSTPATISVEELATNNVINLYYRANTDVPYTVNYWIQKEGGDPSIHDETNYELSNVDLLYGEANTEVTPEVYTNTAYISPSPQTVVIAPDGSTVVNYYYPMNMVRLTVRPGVGIESVSGAGIYQAGSDVTIDAVVKAGYTWENWNYCTHDDCSNEYPCEDNNIQLQKRVTFSMFDTPITAVAEATPNTDTPYIVRHWIQNVDGDASIHDGANYSIKDTDNLQGTTDTQVTPETKTYTGFTSPSTQTITIAGTGSTVVNYYYTRNSYDVTLDKDNGIATVTGAGSYLYEAEVTLTAEVKDGYTWKEWTGDKPSSDQTYTFTMPANNVENKANTNIVNYTIIYEYYGEIEGGDNPTTYNVETETFELKNPFFNGYQFIGWTGSNGTEPQMVVTIPKGSTGNKSYKANYVPIDMNYTVNHWQQKLTGNANIYNDVNYTLKETDNLMALTDSQVTPETKDYTGFTAPSTQTVTIAADGSTVVDYYYTRNSYNVSLDKDNGIATVTGAGSYLYEAEVTITAEVKDGYTWKDWTGTKASTTKNYTFTMPADNVDNKANTTINTYSITCTLNDGTLAVDNPTSYTVETDTFTLNNPSKTGYIFTGWTGSNGTTPNISVTIPKGTTGNLEYVANYNPITYTITYDGNGATSGNTEQSTHTYDEVKNLTSNGYERKYTITYDYNYDEQADTTQTVAYGFNGWNDAQDGSGNSYNNEAEVLNWLSTDNANKDIYAQWTTSSYTNTPTREGYIFAGWYDNEETTGNRLDVNGEYTPTSDITLYAKWEIDNNSTKTLQYTVEYYKDGDKVEADTMVVTDVVQVLQPDTITVNSTLINENDKYEGYRLDHTDPATVPSVVNTGTTIKVYYVKRSDLTGTINHYLTKADGTNATLKESTPLTGLIFNDVLTGENYKNTYAGYTYYSSNPETIVVEVSAINNVINLYYRANTNTSYIVKHWTQNLTGDASIHNEVNYTLQDTDPLNGETNTQVTPETKTYTGFTSPSALTVTIAGDGSTEVNYYYTRNSYDVTIDKDNGIATVTGTGSYLYEAEVTLTAEVKDGYTWKEWTGNKPSSDQTYTFTMPANNVENKANTTINTYSITYTLNDGTLAVDNPTSYTVETDSFTLNNPSKIGYTFIGWTGSNGTTPQTNVTIPKGTTGNIEYVANYSANADTAYVVKHWTQNITGDASIHDEVNYTLKDTDNLQGTTDTQVTPPVKTTYTGFTAPSTQTVTIAADGSTVVDYYYTRNSYNVTLDKDDGIATVTGAGSYLYEAEVTITAEVKDGYTWKDWTGDKASSDQTYTFTMPADNVDNKANTTINTYSITYTLNNGTVTTDNPTSYTVETDTFTLNNPSKTGYIFTGWTGSNGTTPEENVTIPKGTTGNIEYVANYNPITYTITYDGNGATGGETETSNHTYDVPKNLTPNGYERKYTITYDYNYDEQADTTKTVSYGFNGWNDTPDGSGNSYNNEAEVLNCLTTNNDNKVIYADWTSTSDTNNPTRFGYIFAGWYEDEATTGNRVDTNGEYTPTSDKTLYAKWIVDDGNTKEVSYTVEYYKDGTIVPEDTQVVTDTIQVLEPDIITVVKENINTTNKYEGYRLDTVEPNPIPNTIASGSTIKVKYVKRTDLTGTINHYLTKADGTNATLKESTPLTGLIFNDVLTGENYKNTYAGYTYYSSNPETIVVEVSAINNVINLYYRANTNTSYTVKHWTQNLTGDTSIHDEVNYTLQDTDSLNGETNTQVTPETKTYTGFTSPSAQTITIAGDGSTEVNYYYTRNSYDITLDKDNGIATVTGTGSYLYEAEVTITAEVKDGYTWKEWTGDKPSSDQTYTFTMPANNVENKANTTINTYSITYTLNDGTLAVDNPTSYTVETDSFTLNNPSKTGYTFVGWTGTNGTTPNTNIIIPKGTIGNLEYVANYSANTNTAYVVKHWTQNITGDASIHDEVNYTLKDTDNLQGTTDTQVTPPVKTTYTGFTAPTTQTVTIAADGSTIVDYYYTRNSYNVTLDKDNGIATVTGAGSYLYEAEVTITAEVKDGYTWKDWTGDKASSDQTYTFTMPADNVENKANTTINTYSITYTLNDGEVEVDNPTSYTVETDTFTLNNPSKIGYIFTGWTGSNGTTPEKNVTVSKGTTGNIEYVANYDPITYTVEYDGNGATGGNTEPSTHIYDVAKNLTPNGYERKYTITYDYNYDEKENTTKTVAYTFAVWSDGRTRRLYNDEESVMNLISTNNGTKTIYAIWDEASDTNLPTRTGYKFEGWYDNEETTGNRLDTNGVYTPTADITLYAKWGVDDSQEKELKYTLEYYKDNVLAESKDYTKTVQVLEPDTLEVIKSEINTTDKYVGYDFVRTDPTTIPDVINHNSTIKVYYEIKDYLTYTVKYIDVDTNEEIKTAKPVGNQTYNTVVNTSTEVIDIDGYNFDHSEVASITISVDESANIINLYYKKAKFNYTVEYYYDNVIDNTKTDTFQATYKDKISTYQAKPIDGYTLDRVEPAELEIGYVAANNVMRVYYKKAKFNYTVEYYYDNVIDSTKTETKQATYKDTISTYTSKNITGYALNNVANLPLTISSNEANNIIKVYYVRAPYNYTVNYYFNNVIRPDLSETHAALFNDSINTYDDKVEVGYKLDRVETLPLVVTENNDANILSVYYITDPDQTKELKYTIKYYKDGVESNSDEYTKTVQVLENDIIEVDKTKINTTDKYDGYYFVNTDPSTIPDEVTTGTIIKVNYTIRNDLSYTVEYWDKDENETIKTSKVVDNQTFNSEILSTNEKIDIDGYDYDSVSADSITIKTDNSLNIIKFYYTKRTNLEYKVNYLLKDSDSDDSNNEVIHSQKVQGNMIFKSVVTSSNEVIDIDGYNYDSVNVGSITISANVEQNIINVFYTKRTDLKYTVNYLEKDSDDDDSNNKVLMTQKVQENQTFGTIINSANEVIAIAGYNYLAPSVNSISVKTEEALNVITLYYTPRTDLSYKVNYLLKDSDDDDSNNTVLHASKTVSNQSYLAEINPADEEVFVTGYKVASYSSNPLIIGLDENVLTIYYSKDESQTDTIDYTIQYYKDGVIVPTDTENNSSTIYILDKITFTPNVNKYEGYNYDSVNSVIPEHVTDGAVIKVYYTSRTDLSYTVQYLQKETSEVLHSAKVYDNQTYGDSIVSANEVISIDGYNYDSSNVPNLVIGTDENENIIKLYYTKRADLSYVVNYLELSTNKVLHSQKVYNNITFDSEIKSIDEIISIDGYKYDSANVNSIKIKTNVSQNVINIYYTKVTGLAYTVRYLDKSSNEEIATAKVVDNQTFEDEILTSDEIVSIDGYTYDSTNVDKLIIGTNNTENVINIYYNKRNDLSYSVKYIDRDTNTQIESPKVVNNQVFNTQIIASSEIKEINGYNFDHLNVDKLSIGTGQNVIIVYYSKVTGLTYKVNYLLLDSDEDDSNNVKLAESKIGSNKTYKDEINPTNEEKVITGYKVAKYSSNPLVITTDESKNVLTIYYEKDETQTKDIHYTIQYYKDNVLVTTDTENYSSTIYVLDEITFTPNVNKYEGYEFDSVNSIIPNSIGNGQVIKVLFTKRKDLSYKVNYYEKGTNVILHEPLQVTNVPYEKVVKLADVLKDIPGYKFAEADNSEITIGVNIELNVINVFYTKRTDLSYIVKYIDKETGEEIKNSKVVPQKLLGEVIDSKDEIINVDGYNYDSVEEDYLTIGASLNEMKIYYTKRNDIEYTIEYYFDDVLDPNLTENIKAIYLQKIDEYKKAQRKGYTLDKEESFPLTISYIQEDNIIKIFYKRIVVPIRITSIDRITGRIIDYYEIGSRYGDEYIVNEKEFDGYNYVGTPSNIVGLTDTEVIDVTFYYEPLQNKSNSNNNTNNSVIKVQDTGLNVISYNIIIGVIFITIGMTVLIIYTSKDKKNKETKAKF